MSTMIKDKSSFDYFVDGLVVLVVAAAIVLCIPVALIVLAFYGLLKRTF